MSAMIIILNNKIWYRFYNVTRSTSSIRKNGIYDAVIDSFDKAGVDVTSPHTLYHFESQSLMRRCEMERSRIPTLPSGWWPPEQEVDIPMNYVVVYDCILVSIAPQTLSFQVTCRTLPCSTLHPVTSHWMIRYIHSPMDSQARCISHPILSSINSSSAHWCSARGRLLLRSFLYWARLPLPSACWWSSLLWIVFPAGVPPLWIE